MKVLLHAEEEVRTPEYADNGCSGADVFARVPCQLIISPGKRSLVPTGLRVELPAGYEIQVRPRSGLALKHGVTVLNTPGTIDESYRGEIGVIIINHGTEPFVIEPGMKIAQLVMMKVERMEFERVAAVEDLSTTERGAGGFGHTGA